MRARPWFGGLLLLASFVGSMDTATAHSSDGELTLEASRQGAGVEVRARLVYANDLEPVSAATVTLEGAGPAGSLVPPQTMERQGNGIYRAVVTPPTAGSWTFRVSSATPTATAALTFEVAATTTTTTASSVPPERRESRKSDDRGPSTTLMAAAVGGLIVAGALGLRLRSRRRNDR